MAANKKKIISAHVPHQLADRIDELITRTDTSSDSVVEQALTAWTDQEDANHRMTLDALDDVRAGRVVPHARVTAWITSLDR